MTIRRILALGTMAALALVSAAAGRPAVGASADSSPATKLTRALAVSHVPARRSSVLAVDLRTGEIVYSRNPGLALAPASNEKLAVSYALLRRLGPAYRIRTTVTGSGRLVGSTWRGDLVLEGRGDPTLSYKDLKHLAWMVRGVGIRRVTGSIVGDESYFELILTATDNGGLTNSTAVSSHPQTVTVTIASAPSGRQVVYDGTSTWV